MAKPIHFFGRNDRYSEFSSFAPFGFTDGGVKWPTVEHYFQAQKFVGPEVADHRERVQRAHSPKQAKSLGQSRRYPLRADWEEVKEDVMRRALRLKFANPEIRTLLLSTGRRPLVEASPTDRYWGAGADGRGKNRLGHLLAELRAELLRK